MNGKETMKKLQTVTCQVCGKPVEVQDVTDAIGEGPLAQAMRTALLSIAPAQVHDTKLEGEEGPTCLEILTARKRAEQEQYYVEARKQGLALVVPAEYQNTDPKHPEMNTAPALEALSWTWGRIGLLLKGATGRAKSRCAYTILYREYMSGRTCEQFSAGEWEGRCRVASYDGRAFDRWLHRVKTCEVLLIDDLGKARLAYQDNEATRATEFMFDVLDSRGKYHLPTIVTTNMGAKEFKAKWGEHGFAFARRLVTYCKPIDFGGGV